MFVRMYTRIVLKTILHLKICYVQAHLSHLKCSIHRFVFNASCFKEKSIEQSASGEQRADQCIVELKSFQAKSRFNRTNYSTDHVSFVEHTVLIQYFISIHLFYNLFSASIYFFLFFDVKQLLFFLHLMYTLFVQHSKVYLFF